MTQAGILSANTVYMAHLYYVIHELGKNKNKNWSNFLKSIFAVHCPAHLNYLWQFFFCFCYKLSNFLALIDRYHILLSSDWTIWYNLTRLKTYFLTYAWYFTFKQPCQAIQTNHWEVKCCTVILILPSNKTIRTLTSCNIAQIVTQKGLWLKLE